jgi:hypothetical protein
MQGTAWKATEELLAEVCSVEPFPLKRITFLAGQLMALIHAEQNDWTAYLWTFVHF